MDNGTLAVLQGIVRREGRSLLQYIGDSFPWPNTEEAESLAKIEQMVLEEQEAVVALTSVLAKKYRRPPPYLGPYPMTFTNINFVTLAYLVPLLIDYQKRSIAELESDLVKIANEDMAERVQKILDMKQRNLKVLVELAATGQKVTT